MNKQSRISSFPEKAAEGLIVERGRNRRIYGIKDARKFPNKTGRSNEILNVSTDVAAFSPCDEQSRGPNAPAARQQNCVSRSL